MDSKKRHELEQNELAKWMIAQHRDWIQPNSSWLGYAILGVLLVVLVIMLTARVNTRNLNSAWKQYYHALHSPQADAEFELIANSTSSVVGVHARLALAQQQLTEGCSQVFIDKNEAIVMLEKAIASFQQVQKASSDPLIAQQADFGLAQCWEALAATRVGEDRAKALEAYQKVAERWEETFVGQRAKKQLALLQQPTTKLFLELTAAKTVEASEDDFRMPFSLTDPFEQGQMDFGTFERDTVTEEQTDESDEKPERESEPSEE